MKKSTKAVLIISSFVLAAVAAVGVYRPAGLFDLKSAQASDMGGIVLATVNGRAIHQAEVAPLQQRGIDRTMALDRLITQAVLAQAAEKSYASEAKLALASVHNDILSQVYTSKRTQTLRTDVTDKEISEFYEKNVTAEQGRLLKVKGFVTSDAKEAQTMYQQASGAKEAKETKDAIAKMQYLNKEAEHFSAVQDIPYNLGQVIKKMKVGDVMQPVVIREGILVALLEDFKDQPRPALEKVKEEIRTFLVNQKIEKEVQELRKASKIELKG